MGYIQMLATYFCKCTRLIKNSEIDLWEMFAEKDLYQTVNFGGFRGDGSGAD